MKKVRSLCVTAALLIAAGFGGENNADQYWPQWRGPRATGVAPNSSPPTRWSESENIDWKVEIPGKGSSTPIIWENSIFLTTAVPVGENVAPTQEEAPSPSSGRRRRGPRGIVPDRVQQFTVIALDRATGAVIWKKVVEELLPHEGTHPTGTWASGSPVTDGAHVWAFFGSRGLYCLDMDGNLIWEKDLGDMQIRLGFGEGASPALYQDRIIVNWDHEGQSFIVALDKRTGRELWRTDREEQTSWTTPLVVEHASGAQVVTSATRKMRSYDVQTGKLIWEGTGMTLNPIPSPVAAGNLVYLTSGFRGNALVAIDLGRARGNIVESDAIAWSYDRDTPYAPSPLLYEDTLYVLKSNNGILTSFRAGSGEKRFGPVRLDGVPNVYASPVGAAGRVYIAGREGSTAVIKHGPEFELLAVNTLDDGFDASPVVVDDELYLRGKQYLYRISEN